MPSVDLHLHSTLLSAVAGYVDAAGFASLLGLFPAHLTGELVADALAVSSGHFAAHTRLWAFPVFVGAVVLATLVARIFRHYGLQARAGLLALVTLALALFSISDPVSWLCNEGPAAGDRAWGLRDRRDGFSERVDARVPDRLLSDHGDDRQPDSSRDRDCRSGRGQGDSAAVE